MALGASMPARLHVIGHKPVERKVMHRLSNWIKLLTAIFLISFPVAFSPTAQAQTKMTVAYSSVGPMATGVWMAKESGAFDKYGIQADIIYIASGPVVVQALIGGDLQVGSGASNAVINAILNGAPIIGVAATANRPYHRLFVQQEINKLEDLRGKTLGVTRFGSITDNLTRI
jgi:ABC-type nitrate/sulfonate/bicarbonate transport system substrate-binding protein